MNEGHFRTPNPEIRRASTVLFDSIAELEKVAVAGEHGDPDESAYGTFGTPTTRALEKLLLAAEGGAGVALAPSGLAAITTALLAVVRSGDHLLVTDSAYGPVCGFCDTVLARLAVEIEYYDPMIGGGIAERIRPSTAAIWLESPGSLTFEVQDVPAIVAAARAADHRVITLLDNTYGSPGLYRPLDAGVDVSVVALTKYWSGHSDVLMGAVFATEEVLPAIRSTAHHLGMCTNADEAYLVARGARTVNLRMAAHGAAGLEIARRLAAHPRVGRVLHPSLPDCPGHELFERDFRGPNGLFSFELLTPSGGPASRHEANALCDALAARGHFGIGFSWGGFESLAIPAAVSRTVRPWHGGALVRLHVGLEPVETLWADLIAALEA